MARIDQPLTKQYGSNDDAAQAEFWRELAERPLVSNDEAFHGLLLYAYPRDPANDYAGRVRFMKQNKLLPASFDRPADESASRAVLATAITRILHVRGGLMMRLTDNSPRYALLELQDMDLFPPSSENQTFSGSEFVGVIGKIEDYQHGDTSNLPAYNIGPSPVAANR